MPAHHPSSGRRWPPLVHEPQRCQPCWPLARPPVPLVRPVDLAHIHGFKDRSRVTDVHLAEQMFMAVDHSALLAHVPRSSSFASNIPHPPRTLKDRRSPHCRVRTILLQDVAPLVLLEDFTCGSAIESLIGNCNNGGLYASPFPCVLPTGKKGQMHVLSNSWYWCPSCEKAEQFAEPIPAPTGESKTGPASRIVGFVTSSIPKGPSAKSTTGGIWKHFSNKLSFLSHPSRVKDNTMGKAELDGGPEPTHEQNIEVSAHDDGLDGSPATIVAEKDGLPVQGFAPGDDVRLAALRFFPNYPFTAELGSTPLAELHDSQPVTGLNPKYSELSADDSFQFNEAAAYEKTSMLVYPEPRSELSTYANDGHPDSGLDLKYLIYQADVPNHDHLPPYQNKTFGNVGETQVLGNRLFTSPESTAVLPGGLIYSTPIEMPETMPETWQSRLTDGRRSNRSYHQLMVPGHPSLSSDESDPQDSYQHTDFLQNHETIRPSLYQRSFTRGRPDDDGSLGQVRSLWYFQSQASQSAHVQRTAVANRLGGQAEFRNHSDDSHLVSPMSSPDLYSPSEHPHIVSPSSLDFNRGIPGDQRSSLDSSNMIGASTDSQTPDTSESFNCSSQPELNDVHQLEARLRTSPASSLSEKYSHSSSGPSTSAASSHRDSIRSSKISLSTQATSTGISLMLPSNQDLVEVAAVPQDSNLQEISKCPECSPERPTVFRGKPQDRKSNMNRHLLYCHGEKKKFPCPVHGCSMESSRPDNVRKHLRTVDHDVTLKRSNARRKKRNV
ncbi:MAG: hypothetical protein Q9192_002501 [Flavoplaca navasiana]